MKPSNALQVIILIGPPGSGKGTQAELLSSKFHLAYLETAEILEQTFWDAKEGEYLEAEGEKYFLLDEKKNWATGLLCSPPFVTQLMLKKFQEMHDAHRGLLLAGSPRTVWEGEREMPFLANLYGKENIHVIALDLDEKQSLFRNSNRRICELMRHPILFHEETKNLTICPLDGSKLLRREGLDDPENMAVRMQQYRDRTAPLFEYFKTQGITVKHVNGDQSVAEVFANVQRVLNE